MTRTRITTLVALLLAALLMAGCGGSGGGEPAVTQTVHDELQAELDAALADLEEERKAKANEEAARETAEGDVTRLEGELETATTDVGRLTAQLATANTSVESLTDRIGTADDADSLQGMLAAQKARVTTLMNRIGSADDTASDAEGASLHAQLKAAQAEVTRLEGELGTATDMADAAGSLHAQLAAEKDEVTRLETLIGAEADTADDDGSLYARLNHAKDEAARIQGLLDTANGRVDELETLVGDAVNPSSTSLRGQLAAAKIEAATLQGQLDGAREDVTEAERRAREAEQEADRRVAEIERQGDTNTQGRGLLMALEAVSNEDGTTWAPPGDTATVDNNDRDTDIEITASPLTGSTRKSGDFYTATLTRTAPGVNQPERKIVAYTDREKTRTFANHYASDIDATVGGTTSNPRFTTNTNWLTDGIDLLSNAVAEYVSDVSRGGHPATILATASDPADRLVSELSATVHGVSGQYGCYNSTTNAACKINVNPTYTDAPGTTATHHELSALAITAESGGILYFDPGSDTISLLNVAKTGAPATTDEQYITFGWWQERPGMSDGVYQAAVFATPRGGVFAAADAMGGAEYEGPAVGLYVDLTSDGGTTIYESGDFTATAILRATFGTRASVAGDVTNFRTTHGAKNWHVMLNDDDSAEIVQSGTSSAGTWEHMFLARHDNVVTADDQPIAVTGRFDVSIPNVRHIVGAFGAHRTTDPIGE